MNGIVVSAMKEETRGEKKQRHTDKQINWEILRIQYEKKSKKWGKVNIRNKFGRNSKGLRISS